MENTVLCEGQTEEESSFYFRQHLIPVTHSGQSFSYLTADSLTLWLNVHISLVNNNV